MSSGGEPSGWPFYRFALFVTGHGERSFLPELFKPLESAYLPTGRPRKVGRNQRAAQMRNHAQADETARLINIAPAPPSHFIHCHSRRLDASVIASATWPPKYVASGFVRSPG